MKPEAGTGIRGNALRDAPPVTTTRLWGNPGTCELRRIRAATSSAEPSPLVLSLPLFLRSESAPPYIRSTANPRTSYPHTPHPQRQYGPPHNLRSRNRAPGQSHRSRQQDWQDLHNPVSRTVFCFGICALSVPRITDNAISATAFKAMTAPRKPGEREENETQKGLRVQDKGFLNTAVIRSEITYIDGDAGGTCAEDLTSLSDSDLLQFFVTGMLGRLDFRLPILTGGQRIPYRAAGTEVVSP